MKYKFCFLLITFIYVYATSDAKTAPEFTVTVDTENFKEIRIPMEIWKKIVTKGNKPEKVALKHPLIKDYDLTKQVPVTEVPEDPVDTTLHEVLINISFSGEDTSDSEALETPIDQSVPEISELSPKPVITQPLAEEVPSTKPIITQQILIEPMIPLSDPLEGEAVLADPVLAAADAITGQGGNPISVLIQSFRSPCVCEKGVCGCCASMFSQKGCANLKFLPEEFAFDMRMTMNGNVVGTRKYQVNNTPPFCFNPRRAPFVELCAKLSNISVKKQQVHACLDIDANVGGFDLFSWNYNCMKFGSQGFTSKPGETPPIVDLVGGVGGDDGGSDDDDDDDDDDDGGILGGLFDGDEDDEY